MKNRFWFLAIGLILANCGGGPAAKNGWSSDQQAEFLKDCPGEVPADSPLASQMNDICSCILDKVTTNYTYDQAKADQSQFVDDFMSYAQSCAQDNLPITGTSMPTPTPSPTGTSTPQPTPSPTSADWTSNELNLLTSDCQFLANADSLGLPLTSTELNTVCDCVSKNVTRTSSFDDLGTFNLEPYIQTCASENYIILDPYASSSDLFSDDDTLLDQLMMQTN